MFDEHRPIGGQGGVNVLHGGKVILEHAREALLAGEVGAVADPDRDGLAPELLADLDAADVVGHGLGACRGTGIGERAVFVAVGLVDLVLKGVRIHRIEAEAVLRRLLPQGVVIRHLVPREMRADGAGAACQLLDHAAISKLIMDAARFAQTGEAGKAGAAGADAPCRDGDRPCHRALDLRFDVDATAGELAAQGAEVILMRGAGLFVERADQVGRDQVGHCYLVNETALPASTFRKLPVDLAERSEAKK